MGLRVKVKTKGSFIKEQSVFLCSVLLEAQGFLVYLLSTNTHSFTPTIHLSSPAGIYTWLTDTSQNMERYHSNHTAFAWHIRHCHGNSRTDKWAVPGQAGLLTHPCTHTPHVRAHTHTISCSTGCKLQKVLSCNSTI